jgi:chromosome segregation ATPase
MEQQAATIPAEARKRILDAAQRLYEAAGRERFPTVADVRREARSDMNTTSVVMREWKRQQTARPAPVAVAVPEAVQQASSEALAAVWQAAQEVANASLRGAQQAWEIERQELIDSEREVSAEVDSLEARLATVTETLDDARRQRELAVTHSAQLADQLERLRAELAEQRSATEQAKARAEEIEHRAADLKAELDRAHAETAAVRDELSEARALHRRETEQLKAIAAEQIEHARAELATFRGKAEAAQEAQAKKIEDAEAQAAALRGQLEALRGELATVTAKADAAEQLHRDQKKAAAEEALRQAERFTRVQEQRDTQAKETAQAREQAAHLAGQVETLKAQCAALTARLGAKPAKGE